MLSIPAGDAPSFALLSSFLPSSLPVGNTVEKTSTVLLCFADISFSPENGVVDISWSQDAPVVKGKIGDDIFNRGETKFVYKVNYFQQY